MKVIIDTNILINAVGDDFSYTWKIIDLIKQGKIQAVASEKILKENRFIIEKNIKNENEKQRLEDFFARVQVVPVHKKIRAVKYDPEDDKFIECAVETKADFIITSDAHLLDLTEYQGTQILDPKSFWYKYSGQNKDKDEWQDVFKDILRT